MKRNIKYSIRLIMELFCAFWAKIRSFKGKRMFMDCNEAFSFIIERRREVCTLRSLLISFEPIMNFTKKIPSLLDL